MYAKLVATANHSPLGCIRDICRLLTSNSPSTALLGAFSSTSSIIVDNTPAGWTYVGSNQTAEQTAGGVAAIGTSTTHSGGAEPANIALSAPCLNTGLLKYATFTTVHDTDSTAIYRGIALSGAQTVNSAGICTNEAFRPRVSAASGAMYSEYSSFSIYSSQILHLIANPRHITIIAESTGLIGFWETSGTDVHTFYNSAPVVLYNHAISTSATIGPFSSPTYYSGTAYQYVTSVLINQINVNTGTIYGNMNVPIESSGGLSSGSLYQFNQTLRSSTINSAGSPRYQIGPIYFQNGAYGYPVQFVTGVVPIYWTKPGLGNTGDTVDVNGTNYTYFNCGSSGKFGVILTTGN